MAEHIGDHTVLGQICGKNFLKDPGLDRTLLGDGIATFVAGMIGGPANTSYGENTGVGRHDACRIRLCHRRRGVLCDPDRLHQAF